MMGLVARLSCAAHDGGFSSPLSAPFYLVVVCAYVALFLSHKSMCCWKQCIIFVVGGKHVRYRYNIVTPEVSTLPEYPSGTNTQKQNMHKQITTVRHVPSPLPFPPSSLVLMLEQLRFVGEVPIVNGFNGFPATSHHQLVYMSSVEVDLTSERSCELDQRKGSP